MGTEKAKRCVIITAGPMEGYDYLRGLVKRDDYIICVDGGSCHLNGLSIKPDIIVGDLDSAGVLPDSVEVLKYKCEKDETDTMLAVMHGLKLGFKDFLLLGGLGGRLDHTFANLCVLQYISRHEATGHFVDGNNEAFFVENGEIRFKRRENYYISVFPFGGNADGVTEKGFKYGLEDAVMKTNFPNGVSNEFKDEEGIISVKSGSLLIILSRE